MKMKKLALAIALSACFSPIAVNAAGPGEDCGPQTAEIAAVEQVMQDMRMKSAQVERDGINTLSTPNVDIKAMSCVDKYSKFKMILAFPWPSIDGLFDKMAQMACNAIDAQMNQMMAKTGLSKQLPYGLGTVGVGVTAVGGQAGSTSTNSGYSNVYNNTGLNVGTQKMQNTSMGDRVTNKVGNLFR